jgi:hypothetical protein
MLGDGGGDVGVGHHVHLDRRETALEEPTLDGGAGGVLAEAVRGGGGGDDDGTGSAGIERRGPGVRARHLVVVAPGRHLGPTCPVTAFPTRLGSEAAVRRARGRFSRVPRVVTSSCSRAVPSTARSRN